MPRFAANLSMMFTELDAPERFRAARDCGFEAVEYLMPYGHPVAEVRGWLADAAKQKVAPAVEQLLSRPLARVGAWLWLGLLLALVSLAGTLAADPVVAAVAVPGAAVCLALLLRAFIPLHILERFIVRFPGSSRARAT